MGIREGDRHRFSRAGPRHHAVSSSPGIVGTLCPLLLLPAGIEERLTPEQMRAVLAHERCHLRWRDNFTAWLHMWVETLFWFFPPVWWIGARMIEERERACDEQVTREGHSPSSYAEGILAVCEHYIASRLPCVSGVSGADLRKRIESIMKNVLTLKLDWPRKLVLEGNRLLRGRRAAGGRSDFGQRTMLFSVSAYTAGHGGILAGRLALSRTTGHRSGRSVLRQRLPATTRSEFHHDSKRLAATVAKLSPDDGEKVLLFAVAANSTRDVQRLLAAGAAQRRWFARIEFADAHCRAVCRCAHAGAAGAGRVQHR